MSFVLANKNFPFENFPRKCDQNSPAANIFLVFQSLFINRSFAISINLLASDSISLCAWRWQQRGSEECPSDNEELWDDLEILG
jgi:hypothetical protein